MNETFTFSSRAKKAFFIMMGIGVLGAILAIFPLDDNNHMSRLWSNIVINSYYFMGIALGGMFFIAVHQVGYGGFQTALRRVPEAMTRFVPWAGLLYLIIVGATAAGINPVYAHWTDAHGDAVIEGKKPFLTIGFFAMMVVLYVVLWTGLTFWWRKLSAQSDAAGENQGGIYKKMKVASAIFLVVFAVTSSTQSWQMIMSIDAHWYSTLFGWYNFASYMCGAFAFMILIVVYLKSRGYLAETNENHIHDLGKYLFGFSIFYTYLWFSQFMLIWYANVPEETIYFSNRMNVPLFKFGFFATFAINFIFPFLVLMTRANKRKLGLMAFVCIVVIGGHFMDFWMMVAPGANAPHHDAHAEHDEGHEASTEEDHAHFNEGLEDQNHEADVVLTDHHEGEAHAEEGHGEEGAHADEHHGEHKEKLTYAGLGLPEMFMFIGFVGFFLFIVFSGLSKTALVPRSDVFMKESKQHHI